jgi:hypothetical protein
MVGKECHGMLLKNGLSEELPNEMYEVDIRYVSTRNLRMNADKRNFKFQKSAPDVVQVDI